jgi:hypothetical protein
MATLWRVNGVEQDDTGLTVVSAPAVETETSFRVEKGALNLSAQVIPKAKREAWAIGLSRDEAMLFARRRIENRHDAASEDLKLQVRKLSELADLALADEA